MFETIDEYLSSISPKFIPLLQNNDIIVSGSTAVYYCMKDNGIKPDFVPEDIDLFISFKSRDEAGEFFESLNKLKDSPEERELARKYETLKILGKSRESSISNVRIAILPLIGPDGKSKVKIDFVFLSNRFKGRTTDHVLEDFDLDICKCWYDGRKLHGPVELLREKRCTLTHISLMTRPVLEAGKLVEYYSSIRNLDPKDSKYIPDCFRTISRIRKYTSRGFRIDTSKLETPPDILQDYIRESIRKISSEVYLNTNDAFRHVRRKIPSVDEFRGILENILNVNTPVISPQLTVTRYQKAVDFFSSVHFLHFFVGLSLIIVFKIL